MKKLFIRLFIVCFLAQSISANPLMMQNMRNPQAMQTLSNLICAKQYAQRSILASNQQVRWVGGETAAAAAIAKTSFGAKVGKGLWMVLKATSPAAWIGGKVGGAVATTTAATTATTTAVVTTTAATTTAAITATATTTAATTTTVTTLTTVAAAEVTIGGTIWTLGASAGTVVIGVATSPAVIGTMCAIGGGFAAKVVYDLVTGTEAAEAATVVTTPNQLVHPETGQIVPTPAGIDPEYDRQLIEKYLKSDLPARDAYRELEEARARASVGVQGFELSPQDQQRLYQQVTQTSGSVNSVTNKCAAEVVKDAGCKLPVDVQRAEPGCALPARDPLADSNNLLPQPIAQVPAPVKHVYPIDPQSTIHDQIPHETPKIDDQLVLTKNKGAAEKVRANNEPGAPRETGAQAPGLPRAEDGYTPPKNWDGKKVKHPQTGQWGYPDKKGDVWVPTGVGPLAHRGPHWDVIDKNGDHRNVLPGGKVC